MAHLDKPIDWDIPLNLLGTFEYPPNFKQYFLIRNSFWAPAGESCLICKYQFQDGEIACRCYKTLWGERVFIHPVHCTQISSSLIQLRAWRWRESSIYKWAFKTFPKNRHFLWRLFYRYEGLDWAESIGCEGRNTLRKVIQAAISENDPLLLWKYLYKFTMEQTLK